VTLLGVTGSETLSSTSTVSISITGTTPGDGVAPGTYTQINVSGSINLNNAVLQITHSATTAEGSAFVIVQASGGVSGTFNGLNQGATVVASDGTEFTISYQVNGGQEVVLTQLTNPPVSPSQSSVTVAQTTVQAGNTTTVTLTARDANGNQEPSGGLTVVFGLGAGGAIGTFSPVTDQGNGTYTATFTAATIAGSNTITATFNSQAVTSTLPTITVTAGPFSLSQSSVTVTPASVAVGSTATVTLTARDAYGNPESSGGLTVAFGLGAGNGNGTFSAVTDNGNGTYTATFTATTAGSNTITATINNLVVTATAPTVTIPGVATQLTISGPQGATIGSPVSETITAYDASGNVATGYTGTVHFTSTDRLAGLPSNYTFQASDHGTHTFMVTEETAGPQTLTVTDTANSSITGSGLIYASATGPLPPDLTAVSNELTHSYEYYYLVVVGAYQKYLGRMPTLAEANGWVGDMQNGLSDEQLEAGFIGSTEYISDHGGAGAGWVIGMYQNLLGRTPSAAEVAGWVQALADGWTTTAVAYGFATSVEAESDRVAADYETYFGRAGTAPEIAGWVNYFEAGGSNENVIGYFVGSLEFWDVHGESPSAWLDTAYFEILGRHPELTGFDSWMPIL
jgi:hypothetical protein